jgi:hypothetical protein
MFKLNKNGLHHDGCRTIRRRSLRRRYKIALRHIANGGANDIA